MKSKIIPYKSHLVAKARQLRNNATFSERRLWKSLKGKQLLGLDFDRQKPIDNYIVDFYCKKIKLVIEVDGITHEDKKEYDQKRQKRLEDLGLSVLRFNAIDVVNNTSAVVESIENWIEKNIKY